MNDEQNLIISELSTELSNGGRTVNVEIFRLEHEKEWALAINDEFNNSTVWDDTFTTDSAALTEAKKAILEEGVNAFIGPEDGKGDESAWK